MKKMFLSFLALTLISFNFISCNKSEESAPNASNEEQGMGDASETQGCSVDGDKENCENNAE